MISKVYFSKLEIQNIKCFGENTTLNLKDSNGSISQWNLILGDNGVGKTTLLKTLTRMIPVEAPKSQDLIIAKKLKENGIDSELISKVLAISQEEIDSATKIEQNTIQIKPALDDLEDNLEFEKMVRMGGNIKAKIEATLVINSDLNTKAESKNEISYSIFIETDKFGKLKSVKPETASCVEFPKISIFAYSANRHMSLNNLDQTELFDPIGNLFSESGDLFDPEQVLSNLFSSTQKDDTINKINSPSILLEKVKKILSDILPDLKSPDDIKINPPFDSDGNKNENLVEIKGPYGKVPLQSLSLGYKTMFAWVVDLALRMLWENPGSENPLEASAIVIVDEIDLHLHPKWQKDIRDFLIENFKNTQFICTAHSPIMAQSSEKDNISVIIKEQDFVKIENRPKTVEGWKIGQFVTNFFDISERSNAVENLITERRELLSKTNKDEERLKQLDDEISNLPIGSEENDNLLNKIEELYNSLNNPK
jgi:predicted ATP-dependent endonuclease of OLD family